MGTLRADYEIKTGVEFKKAAQPSSVSLLFGAKDVGTRNRQILFIEQWMANFSSHLSETNTFSTTVALQKHITALRVLMVVGFYTKSQIDKAYTFRSGASTTLARLIDKAMGITSENLIDEDTRACCFLAAKRYLTKDECFEKVNSRGQTPLTEKQWSDFGDFITAECNSLDPKYKKSDYPITVVMMAAVSKPLELVGSGIGYIAAGVLVNSGAFYPVRYVLTGVIGSCICVIAGPAGTTGAILLTPTVVGHVLNFFCGASLAWFMGNTLRMVGQGVGLGLRNPLIN